MQSLTVVAIVSIFYGAEAEFPINRRDRRYVMSPEMKESLKTKEELMNFLDSASNFADAFLNGYSIEGFFAANSNAANEQPINGDNGFETEDPIDGLTTTTRAMERESGAAILPSAIVDATLKAIGKYSTEKLAVDEHLITASEVFTLLNNATDESFADTFLKIETDKLISALRDIVLPLNSTAWSMIAYLKENTAENKEQFLKYYNPHDYLFVGEIIVRSAESDLRILVNASGYDTTKFDQLRTKFLRYQFELYIFEFFNGGLEWEDEIVRYPYHANIFKIKKNFLWDSFKRAWKEYNDKFFPLYVKENILKSVLDTSGGNNCDLAQSVVDQLKSKCASHKYAVIVSDGVSKPEQYAYYGYPERMVLKEEYNGKSVIAFMASTQYWKKKEAFYSQNHLGIIALDVSNKYNANNLHTLMDFGNNTDGYQTAVYKDRYNPCFRVDMNVSDSLDFEVPSLKWGIWPSSETLSYFIVF